MDHTRRQWGAQPQPHQQQCPGRSLRPGHGRWAALTVGALLLVSSCSGADRGTTSPNATSTTSSPPARRALDADVWIRNKGGFRSLDVASPEILRGSEPDAVRAVEALYTAILLTGGADSRRDAHRPPVAVSAGDTDIVLSSSVTDTVIDTHAEGLHVGPSRFTTAEARRLFSTLTRVLRDAGAAFPSHGARMTQYRTPEYEKLTRIEFSYGMPVVVLESRFSKQDGDRRYSLDVIRSDDSLLWQTVEE